jgi:hypothetical protein
VPVNTTGGKQRRCIGTNFWKEVVQNSMCTKNSTGIVRWEELHARVVHLSVLAEELPAFTVGPAQTWLYREIQRECTIVADIAAQYIAETERVQAATSHAIEGFTAQGADRDATLTGLTQAQADGVACVSCGADFTQLHCPPHVPVGRSPAGNHVFACTWCVSAQEITDEGDRTDGEGS